MPTLTVNIMGFPILLDLEVSACGEVVTLHSRFDDLPQAARQLMLGERKDAFETTAKLYRHLLEYAVPLWHHGLSKPDFYTPRPNTVKEIAQTIPATLSTEWISSFYRTFDDHAPHWYNTGHLLTQILRELEKPVTNWSAVVYPLQAGGPFLGPVLFLVLEAVADPSLRARLINALLFFPSESSLVSISRHLSDLAYTDSIGALSLARTLENFHFRKARFWQKNAARFIMRNNPQALAESGLATSHPRVHVNAKRLLLEQEYTNQNVVKYLLNDPREPLVDLVEKCATKADWLELLGRFRKDFLTAGYQGKLVPDLDTFVLSNLERYKWPTGERHHKRIDPEIRHALYQETLAPETIQNLHDQLYDPNEFRSSNAAMHLAAYCQLPRILARRNAAGIFEYSHESAPADRPPLPDTTVARLLDMTIIDQRITYYNYAGRAIAQLAVDPIHGEGITKYLLQRAAQNPDDQGFVFSCYLLLPTYHLNPFQPSIKQLIPKAIDLLKQPDQAAFGRLLCPLYEPDFTHQFLAQIANDQADQTYSMFEELAQSVNLLHDQYHDLPLAVFHPEYGSWGADAGAEES